MNRVVITGLGVVSPFGFSHEDFWQALLAGKSGIRKITAFDTRNLTCQVGGEVPEFNPEDYMDAKEAKRCDLVSHYSVAGAKLAVQDSGLDLGSIDRNRMGVVLGTGIGGINTIETQSYRLHNIGVRKVSPFLIPSLIANSPSGLIAIELGAKGPNYAAVSACSSGAHAIGEAAEYIARGVSDVMISGGGEATISRFAYAGFCAMKAMAAKYNDNPEAASRPFDADRCGFVMGDGAGILVLESLDHALARGAHIYCELVGYGATCDAHHITMPDPEGDGLKRCMEMALQWAKLKPEDIDYINAHGTSTPYNDKFETLAIKKTFGEEKARQLLISSTKSMTGHLLGAAAGIESVVCAKTIQTQKVAPTINYTTPDPDCDLNYVPNKSVDAKIDVVMSNNLGFGGHNASLIYKRYEG